MAPKRRQDGRGKEAATKPGRISLAANVAKRVNNSLCSGKHRLSCSSPARLKLKFSDLIIKLRARKGGRLVPRYLKAGLRYKMCNPAWY